MVLDDAEVEEYIALDQIEGATLDENE